MDGHESRPPYQACRPQDGQESSASRSGNVKVNSTTGIELLAAPKAKSETISDQLGTAMSRAVARVQLQDEEGA